MIYFIRSICDCGDKFVTEDARPSNRKPPQVASHRHYGRGQGHRNGHRYEIHLFLSAGRVVPAYSGDRLLRRSRRSLRKTIAAVAA